MNKIYEFNIKKNKAGNADQRRSLTFILMTIPKNINTVRPPAEIIKISCIFKPTSSPVAPNNSKIAVSAPAFSSPKRLNSLFMCGNVK